MSVSSNQSCEQDDYFFFERELVALKLQKVELQANDETHHFENQKNQERITYMKEYLKNKKKEMNDLNVQLDEIAPSFEVLSKKVEISSRKQAQIMKEKKDISPSHHVVKVDYEKLLSEREDLRSKSRDIAQIIKDFKRSTVKLAKERVTVKCKRESVKKEVEKLQQSIEESICKQSELCLSLRKTTLDIENIGNDAALMQNQNKLLEVQKISLEDPEGYKRKVQETKGVKLSKRSLRLLIGGEVFKKKMIGM